MTLPLVSVITPTWNRHEKLLNRCIPSVQSQTYRKVEHVIVSDGTDRDLLYKIEELSEGTAFYHPVRFVELDGDHPGFNRYGSLARLAGIENSGGALIAYIDDDDALRPEHCAKLAAVLADDDRLEWAFSQMASHSNSGLFTHIGAYPGPPFCGQIGTPMIMHRRETLRYGTWGPAGSMEDWELVQRWLTAGLLYGRVHEPTVDVWPSAYWGS